MVLRMLGAGGLIALMRMFDGAEPKSAPDGLDRPRRPADGANVHAFKPKDGRR